MIKESDNISNSFNNSDLSNIYKQIAVEEDVLFDARDEKNLIIDCIIKTFDKEFLLIETEVLLRDTNKLNISFVNLIVYCKKLPKPYTQVHKIFIEYCDYFNIPYNKGFNLFHEKLQTLVKRGFINMIGKTKFEKIDNKLNPNKIFTLFDMVNK